MMSCTASHITATPRRAVILLLAATVAFSGLTCARSATGIVLTVTFDDGLSIDQVRITASEGTTSLVTGVLPQTPAASPLASGETIAILLPNSVDGFVDVAAEGLLGGIAIATGNVSVAVVPRAFAFATVDLAPSISPPISIAVVGTPMVNPPATINAATASATDVEVELPSDTVSGDLLVVTLTVAATAPLELSMPITPGGGTMLIEDIDVSAFADGSVTLQAMIQRGKLFSPPALGTAVKDTVVSPLDVDPVITPTPIATQTISGLTEPGASVSITGGILPASGTASSSGAFAIDVGLLIDTTTSLTVTATDIALNTSNPISVDRGGAPLAITHGSSVPDVTFTDVSATSGADDAGPANGIAIADVDDDGDFDLFLADAEVLLINNGDGTFTDSGLLFTGAGRSAVFADFDNDGDPDLGTTNPAASIYVNMTPPGGPVTFLDATLQTLSFMPGNTEGAAWIDYDMDGRLDFFLQASPNNALFHNGAALPFQDTAMAANIDTDLSNGNFVAVADFDVDGDVDLVLADEEPGQFFRNLGNGTFEEVGALLGVVFDNDNSQKAGMAFGDFDNDADLDLLILRAELGSGTDNLLFQWDGASFTNVAAEAGVEAGLSLRDGAWGDLDLDGRLDLFAAANGPNALFLNRGDSDADGVPELENVAAAAGVDDSGPGISVMLFDVEGDGDLDVYVANNLAANVLYINELQSPRHLTVLVEGSVGAGGTANRHGIGAVVQLLDESSTIVMTREVSGARGKGSHDPRAVHFGGVYPSFEYTVRVTFPGGATVEETVRPYATPVVLVAE